jgi:hypothetical protein
MIPPNRLNPDDLQVGSRYLHSNGSFIRAIDSIEGDTVRWHDQSGPGICSRRAFLRVCYTPATEAVGPETDSASEVPSEPANAVPAIPLERPAEFTLRDQANALTAYAFRNGFLEELHAGRDSPLLDDPRLSRITDDEMKRLMIEACEKLAEMLRLKENDPAGYDAFIRSYHRMFCRKWKRD